MPNGARFTITDPGEPRRLLAPGVHDMAQRLRDDAAANTPVDTGTLQAGWRVEIHGDEARVVNHVPYAAYVEYGTRYQYPQAMLGRARADAQVRTS